MRSKSGMPVHITVRTWKESVCGRGRLEGVAVVVRLLDTSIDQFEIPVSKKISHHESYEDGERDQR